MPAVDNQSHTWWVTGKRALGSQSSADASDLSAPLTEPLLLQRLPAKACPHAQATTNCKCWHEPNIKPFPHFSSAYLPKMNKIHWKSKQATWLHRSQVTEPQKIAKICRSLHLHGKSDSIAAVAHSEENSRIFLNPIFHIHKVSSFLDHLNAITDLNLLLLDMPVRAGVCPGSENL